jgi:uncharacterized repeat protein (TIGR01451 family)
MSGRILRVAVVALFVALALPVVGLSLPLDQAFHHKQEAKRFFAACPGGPACIDLDVHQGDVPDPVPAGDTVTYKIVLQNHGPDTAPSVTLTDTLPPGTTCVNVSSNVDQQGATPSCNTPNQVCTENDGGGIITCEFGDIENTDLNGPPAIGPRTVDVTVRPIVVPNPPPNFYPDTITNTVSVISKGDAFDRNPDTNRSLENTTVTSPGDIRLTKSHPNDPVAPSNTFVYNLKLTNIASAPTLAPTSLGGTVDQPITVTDTLPHGFVFVGTQPDSNTVSDGDANLGPVTTTPQQQPSTIDNQCTATDAGTLENSIVTCHPQVSIPGTDTNQNGVAGGGFYTIKLLVEAVATSRQTFVNNAKMTKYGGDVTPGDDFASDPTKVSCPKPGDQRVPALCVTKSDSVDPVPQGSQFTYTIGVTNERTGSEDAFTDPVTVTDNIPAGMTVVSTSVSNGSCAPVSGGVLTCTLNPDINPGSTRTITVTIIPLQVGTFENLACIDVFERRTCAIESTTVVGAADLSITKTGAPVPAQVNSDLTYTIVVTNHGPASVPNVQMDDSIPAGVDFVSSSVSAGTAACALVTATNFHCNLGTMAPTAVITVTVVVKPTVAGALSNTATVANDGSPAAPIDFDLTNNSATFVVDARDSDLSITKSATPEPVGVGQPLTYTIVVTNNGPGIASGVKVSDPLPTAVTSTSVTISSGTCTGSGTITCTIGVMNPTDVVTLTIQATPVSPGSATNTATVTSDSLDPNLANNSATVTTTITASDMTISKSAGPDPVAIGTSLTYTLRVTNLGPNRATGVTVRDTLPDSVALPTATPSQGTCFGSPTVTCVLGDLTANSVATVTIVVTPIVSSVSITNTATVSSAFDLNSSNNTASVTSRVIDPRLDVTPDLGTLGFVPFAVGTDFPPNAPVQLHWRPGLGVRTVVAGPDGTFRVPMLVLPHDLQGPRTLVATALQPELPATAFLDTSTNFLVVPATAQPFQVKPQFPTTKLVQRSG